MSKLTIYVARHGKTLMNTLDKVQGWCDSPLTAEGIEVAEHLGLGLKDIEFRSTYCSDLRRTLQTARIVLKTKGQEDIPITEMEGLKEACFGGFEAGSNKEMWGNAGLYLQYTSLEKMDDAIARGEIDYPIILDVITKLDTMGLAETYDQVRIRTQAALTEIAEREVQKGDGNILVIAHGVSITAMLFSLGGDKLMKDMLLNASISKVVYQDGKFTVESMGDMSYAEKGKALSLK